MKIIRLDNKSKIEKFLMNTMTINQFSCVHSELGVSRKMLTVLFREPARLSFSQLNKLSDLTKQPIDKFKQFI